MPFVAALFIKGKYIEQPAVRFWIYAGEARARLGRCFHLCCTGTMTSNTKLLQSSIDFGATLRSARKSRQLTQAQAAALAGVGIRLWNEAEKGKRAQVGLETALRMLRAVGVSLQLAELALGGGISDVTPSDHENGAVLTHPPLS